MNEDKTPEEAYQEYVDSEFENILEYQFYDDEAWVVAMFELDNSFDCNCPSCAGRRNAWLN